ncbi:ABC transporter permease subunit [Mycoplasmatota bacterium WC44]
MKNVSKQEKMKTNFLYLTTIVVSIFMWTIFAIIVDNSLAIPMPDVVFKSLLDLLTKFSTYQIIGSTISRLLLSLTIAGFSGLALGLLAGIFKDLETLVKPIVTILRTLPIVSIILVIIILLGYEKSPYIITFLMIFPVVYQAIVEGIKNIPKEHIEVLKLESNGLTLEIIRLVYIPLILPFIKTAFTQSIGLGIKVLVMSEFLAQTKNSIGYMIYLERQNLNLYLVYSWTIILIIIVLVIEYIAIELNKLNEY